MSSVGKKNFLVMGFSGYLLGLIQEKFSGLLDIRKPKRIITKRRGQGKINSS